MWKRKQLKKSARTSLKQNYLRMVIVCLLVAVFASNNGLSISMGDVAEISSVNFRTASNTEIVNSMLNRAASDTSPLWDMAANASTASKGILAGVFNNVTRSGNVIFGILNAVNQFIFGDTVTAGIIVLVGVALTFLYWLFVGNVLRVGECRYFMENATYEKSKPERILFLFNIKRLKNPVRIMFFRTLYNGLWYLTIVGGFIKLYSYRMIPYLLAENPDITQKEAFLLSRRMMKGQKWRAFLLDASFFGWYVLSMMTYGILGILVLYPYKNAADAELYLQLRQNALKEEPGAAFYLHDEYLTGAGNDTVDEYPAQLYPIPENPAFGWLSVDCHKQYSLRNLVLMFFTFAMGGYLWEVFVDLVNTGHLVNRGTLFGPWVPIYGVGGMLVVVLLRRFSDRPLLTFALTVALCGVVEYVTSWALEVFFGAKWWDYSGYFLNINGRVCAEGLLVFGLGGCLGIYVLAPSLDNLLEKIPKKTRTILCAVLVTLFLADVAYSSQHPNMAASNQNPNSSTAMEEQTAQAAARFPLSVPGATLQQKIPGRPV